MKKLLQMFLLFIFILFSCSERKLDNFSAGIFEFDIDGNRLIVVPAKIGDIKCNLMVDTGCDVCIFRKDFAEKLNKSYVIPTFAIDANKNTKIESLLKSKQNLRIGDFNFGKFKFTTDSLDIFFMKNIDGIIGTNILKHCILKLDYSNKKGYLIPFNKFKKADVIGEYEKTKIDINSHISIEIDKNQYKMLIDSGAVNTYLDLDNSVYIKDLIKLKKLKSEHKSAYSLRQVEIEKCKSESGFSIGKLKLKPIIYNSYKFKKHFFQKNKTLIAGLNFISELNWIFDYMHNTVYIAKDNNRKFILDSYKYKIKDPVLCSKDGSLNITWYFDKNPLQNIFDIKSSDRIYAINNISYKSCIEKFGEDKGVDLFFRTLYSLDFDTITVIRNGRKLELRRKK